MMSRRAALQRAGTGLGVLGLASVLPQREVAAANPLSLKPPHFRPRAKHIIHLYMNGGPSQVDTFDHKPALATHAGQRPARTDEMRTENGTGGLRPSPV